MRDRFARCLGVVCLVVGLVCFARPSGAVQIQKVMTDGLEAWLVEDHANPIIAFRVAFRGAGAAVDPADKSGLARMTAALLDEGAGDLDSQAFQRRLEDLAIRLGFDADLDNFGGSFETLTANRDAASELMRLALTQPRFDPEAVGRIRSQLEASLRSQAEDPDWVANRQLWTALFPNHPYGRPVEGTPESLPRIDRDSLERFAAERLARDRMVLGVVGDITPAQLAPLLAATLGALPAKAVPANVADVRPDANGAVTIVDMDVPQSAVSFAQAGLKRDDPQFYTLTVLNQILGGGGLTSRLFDEVREKRGLVYSVYTGLVPLDHAALILGGAGTANERVAETVGVIRDQWRRLATGGITEAELGDSKTYLTGSFPLRFSGSSRLAGLLVSIQLENLGIDYLDRRNALIAAVTRDDVNRLARDLLAPDKLTCVVVGRPTVELPAR
jgi:zinc protease